jgi:CheY-like chemotaxis protein
MFEPAENPTYAPHALIVDDSETRVALLIRMMQYLGFSTAAASNGKEAWEKFTEARATRPFDLVIAGMHMSEMTGYVLGRHLRLIDGRLPLIAMSGNLIWRNPTRAANRR